MSSTRVTTARCITWIRPNKPAQAARQAGAQAALKVVGAAPGAAPGTRQPPSGARVGAAPAVWETAGTV